MSALGWPESTTQPLKSSFCNTYGGGQIENPATMEPVEDPRRLTDCMSHSSLQNSALYLEILEQKLSWQ